MSSSRKPSQTVPTVGASRSIVIPLPHNESDMFPTLSSIKIAPKYLELLLRLRETRDPCSSLFEATQLAISTKPESEPRPIYAPLIPDSNSIFDQASWSESLYLEYTLSSFIEPSKVNCGVI